MPLPLPLPRFYPHEDYPLPKEDSLSTEEAVTAAAPMPVDPPSRMVNPALDPGVMDFEVDPPARHKSFPFSNCSLFPFS